LTGNLHIITLNIPYPPDYGGIIDSYYRIKSLHKAGVGIHLHCFEYGREHSPELESLCKSVNYYPRNTFFTRNLSLKPYTVVSRDSARLLQNLSGDSFPILFDGIHTTFWLDHQCLAGRIKIVRVHNIEHRYYNTMRRFESNPVKKLYFGAEALKLKFYENILSHADILLTVSDTDQEYFERTYHNAELIPLFHPCGNIESAEGTGDYIIFHGDLSVNENVLVAEHLIARIFSKLPYRCIIAGKKPPSWLIKRASAYANISIVPDPDEGQMAELIRNAHVNLLFAIAANGLRLKLLTALFSGRHVLVNSIIIKGTMLGQACHVEDSADGIIEKIDELMKIQFTKQDISKRERLLEPYSTSYNVNRLIRLIFHDDGDSH